jgi:hypothetical protein
MLLKNTGLNKKTNFYSLWLLNKHLIKIQDYGDGTFEIYPAVAFIGAISYIHL